MNPIKIMINGLPGKVANSITKGISNDERFKVIGYSLTGPEIGADFHKIDSTSINLVTPNHREEIIQKVIDEENTFIIVDFTLPAAVNDNAVFYCDHDLPFVMGTTGGDRELLERTVQTSSTCAVVAPNMAKQIVGFQAMMEYASNNFPGLFKGYHLEIKESHQKTKADTSGTAKAMVKYFKKLGLDFTENDIVKIRDPEIQLNELHVPEEYLDGHGWHTYTLTSEDQTVKFSFSHNINGREVYTSGTMDAILFLAKKIQSNEKGKVFSMIDVLRGA